VTSEQWKSRRGGAVKELKATGTYKKIKKSLTVTMFLFCNNVDFKKMPEIKRNLLNFLCAQIAAINLL